MAEINEALEPIEAVVQPVSVTEAQSRAEYDIQISTAKRYPRNIRRAISNSIALISEDKEFAKTCIYSLPRGDKRIQGPSVHLARLIAAEYKNLRVASRIIEIGEKDVTAQAIALDLENNFSSTKETKRRITDKKGQRYNDDMIIMTCNAAMAIATRNAIYDVIPAHIINPVYDSAKKVILGDMSTEQKLLKRRKEVLDIYKDSLNVSEEEILALMGLESVNQIKDDEILTLIGLAQAIKDGDTTVQEAFGRNVDHITDETMAKVQEAIEKGKKARENATLNLK